VNEASRAQARAANPGRSSWVAANAGSGKTRVLTARVARLLLHGTDPARILCLTYTKAAAAEMQNRLFRNLGGWSMMPDPELSAALAELGETPATLTPERLARARTLFARALETPGGLKIQTIHAFCEQLLRRFPLEAGVSPRFRVMDEREARGLRDEVLERLAEGKPAVFEALARHLAGDDPDALLQEIGLRRELFEAPLDEARLARALGVRTGESVEALAVDVLDLEAVGILRALLPVLWASGNSDCRAAAVLEGALAARDPEVRLAGLECVLLYGDGAKVNAPFTAKCGSFPTKAVREANPRLMPGLEALMRRVEAARVRRLAIRALKRSVALHRFARAWLTAFGARKAALGLVDFDDMIAMAGRLLERSEMAGWVLYRLDGGLDHVLVDEAQDTSPAQWRVIEALSGDFFAGAGAREVERTIFVVGDEKQSIYSFQGADPAAFGDMRGRFARMLRDMGAALQDCDLIYSFRSAAPILRLVDAVFGGGAHKAFHDARPGRVELWPFLDKEPRAEDPPWDAALDTLMPDDPVAVLADRIAAEIAGWLAEGRALPGHGRAIRAGDVVILVQRRSGIFNPVIRALKRRGVPVAGADVLRIGAELAVKDLIAALAFAVTPADDLSLAAVLRSPLGDVSEDELFALAHDRQGPLWRALRQAEGFERVRAMLADMIAQADFLRPYELLERLLIRHDGRRRLVARLGGEAEDGIDELLQQALAYEAAEAPNLTGFLGWMARDEVAVKRRVDEGADQVRVMTVHGAKGLESPVVILPDTGRRVEGRNRPELRVLKGGHAAWWQDAASAPPALAEAEAARKAAAEAENRRLLYVALTRAESWLVVAGAGERGNNGSSWHALVEDGMRAAGAVAEPGPDGEVLALSQDWRTGPAARLAAAGLTAGVPDWARRPAPAVAQDVVLSPSQLGGAHALPEEAADPSAEAAAKARGTRLHRLLEHLPAWPRAEWPERGARLLPGAEDAHELIAEAGAVLGAPDLAALFGAEALAEVDVTAALPELCGRRIAGRVDRLVVSADSVLAVDFKSHRLVPETAEAVPEAVLRQMGAYAAALGQIWPGRQVETAVLWTRPARLMRLPHALVMAALRRAGAT
jgi:ATP-dependent helicase/nuclease subunit A